MSTKFRIVMKREEDVIRKAFTGATNVLAHVVDTVFVFYSSLTYSHMLYILFLYKLYFILKQVAWQ